MSEMAAAFCGLTSAMRDTVCGYKIRTPLPCITFKDLREKLALHLLLLRHVVVLAIGRTAAAAAALQHRWHTCTGFPVSVLSHLLGMLPPWAPRSSARRARRMASSSGSSIVHVVR